MDGFGLTSLFVAVLAFLGVGIGVIVGVVSERWTVAKYSAIVCSVALGLLIFAVALDGTFEESESESASADPSSSITSSQPQATPISVAAPEPTATPIPVPTPTPQPTATPVPRVSASELARAYEANEVAAKSKYEEKIALITGEVTSITEARGRYDVKLLTDNFWTNIVCKIEEPDKDSILSLAKGQVITVVGKVKGKGFADIVVDPCLIEQ